MSDLILTKLSQRSLRKPCDTCGAEGPFYEARDQHATPHLVIANEYTRGKAQGDTVPASYLHICNNTPATPVPAPFTPENIPATPGTPAPAEAATPAPGNDERATAAAAIAQALAVLGGPQQVDEAQVRKIVEEMTADIVAPTRTVVMKDGEPREVSGVTHEVFEDVLTLISSKRNVQLYGGPGVGKTHMCAQVAEALGVQLYVIGFHLQSTASELKGYMDARGEFIPTVVYDWATNTEGGLLLTDELDRSHPGIQASLNSLLSNRFIVMPNRERIDLTDKHVVIAATNTTGDGPTWEYPAAQKFSAEFKDRFVLWEVGIDPAIELAAAMAEGAEVEQTRKAVEYVKTVREAVKREAINGVVISPRASQNMAALLAHGMSWDKAVKASIRKGMDDDTWRKVAA